MTEPDNENIGIIYATFYCDPRIKHNRDEGKPVVFTDSNTVGWGKPGDRVAGVLKYIEPIDTTPNPCCTVAIRGLLTVPFDFSHVVVGSPVCIGPKPYELACTSRPYPERLVAIDWDSHTALIQL